MYFRYGDWLKIKRVPSSAALLYLMSAIELCSLRYKVTLYTLYTYIHIFIRTVINSSHTINPNITAVIFISPAVYVKNECV
jgi:hypothetical protein